MKYTIYDKVTDQYLCDDDSWDSYDSEGLGESKPKEFSLRRDVEMYMIALTNDFQACDPDVEIDFEVLAFEEKPYYKFYNA